jgi:hypothetical protein
MVYGLFVLVGGLAALFFLFNAGQLTQDKDKLIITADATAYSAGVMHARALNYTAYTNRALIANEIAVAQMVSVASWTRYTEQHANGALSLACSTWWNVPVAEMFLRYAPLCMGLAWSQEVIAPASEWVNNGALATVGLVELAKHYLQQSQRITMASMAEARHRVMEDVANANFRGNGQVNVDLVPLEDQFFAFEGGLLLRERGGTQRQRMADVAVASANLDSFIPSRRWNDTSTRPVPSCTGINGAFWNRMERAGGTNLIGLDEWKAIDTASYWTYRRNKQLRCVARERVLGSGSQQAHRDGDADNGNRELFGQSRHVNPRASAWASTDQWSQYTGIPSFFELSDAALAYTPENSNPDRRELTIRFSMRVTRTPAETPTSQGRSQIRQAASGPYNLNRYQGAPSAGVYAAVATSEVFFDRPVGRVDGRLELGSAFNPYWQVRLVHSQAAIDTARALQGRPF